MLGSAKDVTPTSLLSIPPKIRVQVFQHLFSELSLQVWYDCHGCRAHIDRHAIAVISTCRQVNTEALPILFKNLELRFQWYPGINPLAQIHPSVKKLVLPHLRYPTFSPSNFKPTVPVDRFRYVAPSLEIVDLGAITVSMRLSNSQMYDAAINKVLAWPPEAIAVSLFNRHLMTVTLSCCTASGDSRHPQTSPRLRALLAEKSHKFSLVGRVRGAVIDEQGTYLEIVRLPQDLARSKLTSIVSDFRSTDLCGHRPSCCLPGP